MAFNAISCKPGRDLQALTRNIKKDNSVFIQRLALMPIETAIEDWLSNLHIETRKNYSYYMNDLMRRGIIISFTSLHMFNQIPHERIIDHIKSIGGWSEGTKQVRAACYISFTSYLNRISQGWFRKAEPSTLNSNKTFFCIRDKCKTRALTFHEWHKFIDALYKINKRDSLIAKMMLQGAKRISEVLSLTIEQIEFERRIIHFKQSKTMGTEKKIPITYPEKFMKELKEYIEKTYEYRKNNIVFITKYGKKIFRTQLNATFAKAAKIANISKVTPHVLRASWVTIAKKQGIPDSEVMKVTGHTSSKMIYAYDKTSAENNYSKKLVLI